MAQLDIKFVNVEKSPALEVYATDHVRNLMKRLDSCPGESKFIDILFRSESKSNEGTIKGAEVLITCRYPSIRGNFHIRKHGTDLRSVLDEAIASLENSLQRALAKKVGGRRRNEKLGALISEVHREDDRAEDRKVESA